MRVVTWNVRGLNQAYKQKELQVFVYRNKVGLLAIVEHSVHQKNVARVVKQVVPRRQWQHNYQVGGKRRIWVVWDARLCDFSVIQPTPQHIHGYLKIHVNNMAFHLTVIDGLHSIQDRKPLWEDLMNIAGLMSTPWLVMCDFNAIMHVHYRTHGPPVQDPKIKDFCDCMIDSGMEEMKSVGRDFTWTNHHTYNRIDRALVNATWVQNWPHLETHVLDLSFSDHSPLSVQIEDGTSPGGKPFKYFDYMMKHPQFMELVNKAWSLNASGDSMQRLRKKIKNVQLAMNELNRRE
ncbi:uncharacterized protein LOC132639349 [Lycium barbarum]|uniref:uncharacterized protein LOC132639349 n=1 Tax=Lycium barbarum TaxID=112863 RepID=UPI00293ED12A|nr:uncharacterized protein LOC132639349 [Lycium barbarum]